MAAWQRILLWLHATAGVVSRLLCLGLLQMGSGALQKVLVVEQTA